MPVAMVCELCRRETAHNFHHLIPRMVHSNRWFKNRYSREEMRHGLHVCKTCHHAIHDLIPDEKELGRRYNTRDKLLAHPQIANYLRWKRRSQAGKDLARG